MSDSFNYDVAFSFAGCDREIARRLAAIAIANNLRVYLDEHHYWEAWGKNLNEYLGDIYNNQSRFALILISEEYVTRAYTNLERRRALDRALESKQEYILPVRLDDSWLEGLPRATAYLDLREIPLDQIGEMLVHKVKGQQGTVILPQKTEGPDVVPLEQSVAPAVQAPGPIRDQPLDFVTAGIVPEHPDWEERIPEDQESWLFFNKWMFDPIFDLTVINRREDPLVLTAVGFEIAGLRYPVWKPLGGAGGAQVIEMHRTYQLQLPDLWAVLAKTQIAQGISRDQIAPVKELAFCRLPDPILIESRRPYRFGLHLFDYVQHCPNILEGYFWARTDQGIARSRKTRLTYIIGSDIPPAQRYYQIMKGDADLDGTDRWRLSIEKREHPEQYQEWLERQAYDFWEQAGRPENRTAEFWQQAEKALNSQLNFQASLPSALRRPKVAGEAAAPPSPRELLRR